MTPARSTVGLREPDAPRRAISQRYSRPTGRQGKEGRAVNTRELLDKMAENLSVRRSLGAAYEREGLLCHSRRTGGGWGRSRRGADQATATGHIPATETTQPARGAPADSQPPTGTGGGFGGRVLPVGVYVVKGDPGPVGSGIRCDPDRPGESQPGASLPQPVEER